MFLGCFSAWGDPHVQLCADSQVSVGDEEISELCVGFFCSPLVCGIKHYENSHRLFPIPLFYPLHSQAGGQGAAVQRCCMSLHMYVFCWPSLLFQIEQRQPYLIFGPLQTMVERSSNGMEKVPSSFIVCCTTWFWNWTTIRHVFCILQEFDAGANTVAQWLKKWRIFTR